MWALKMTSRTTKVSCQLFDSTNTASTVKFTNVLTDIFKDVCDIDKKRHPHEIQNDQPLLLLVQNYTRAGTDIDNATKVLGDIPLGLVVVVLIHFKEPHALPVVMTADALLDEKYDAYGLIADMAFSDGNLYDCKMNTIGRKRLEEFIRKYQQRSKPATVTTPMISVPVQIFCQYDLKEDNTELLGLVQKMFVNPEIQTIMLDAFLKLSKDYSWIVVCKQGHFIEHEIKQVADSYANPKLLLLIHSNVTECPKTKWSEKEHLMTTELYEGHIDEILDENNYENVSKFKGMLSQYGSSS